MKNNFLIYLATFVLFTFFLPAHAFADNPFYLTSVTDGQNFQWLGAPTSCGSSSGVVSTSSNDVVTNITVCSDTFGASEHPLPDGTYYMRLVSGGQLWDSQVFTLVNGSYVNNDPTPTPTAAPTPLPTHQITGAVYFDNNKNGVEDSGEPGIPSFQVVAQTDDGYRVVTYTNGDGSYTLSDVPEGQYTVSIQLYPGFSNITPTEVGVHLTSDSTANFGISPDFQNNFIVKSVNGSDHTFNWTLGTQCSSNNSYLTVYSTYDQQNKLFTCEPTVGDTTDPFPDGTYFISADVDGHNQFSQPFTVVNGTYTAPTYSFTGKVFNDVNQNGIQDAGETGYAGASVTMTGINSASTTTDSSGNYTFSGLYCGLNNISISVPAGYTATTPSQVSQFVSEFNPRTANFGIIRALTSLSPAKVWIGQQTGNSKGIKYDLKADVYKDSTLITSGELDSVDSGGSGFNNANLDTIPFNSFSPVLFPIGSQLKIQISVRNSCSGSKNNGKTARLWFNDSQANSSFGASIGSTTNNYYLLTGNNLGTSTGSGPQQTIDVASGAQCSAFKPFGTWTVTP